MCSSTAKRWTVTNGGSDQALANTSSRSTSKLVTVRMTTTACKFIELGGSLGQSLLDNQPSHTRKRRLKALALSSSCTYPAHLLAGCSEPLLPTRPGQQKWYTLTQVAVIRATPSSWSASERCRSSTQRQRRRLQSIQRVPGLRYAYCQG
jgi:hypothetical protein